MPSDASAVASVWSRTRVAGWIAVAAGIGVALAETKDAAGSLSWRSIDAYLLSTQSGGARALAVAFLLAAVALAARAWRLAAVALLAALGAVAFGGHANSASPRALALLTDWIHLIAGTIWLGGIAQIVATWLPRIPAHSWSERHRVITTVLERFGKVALPAAAIVVVAGVGNALIELGRISELSTTAYGRVLIAKAALVAAVIVASYVHVFVLRPRAMATTGDSPVERRHWRLLGSEPALGAAVLAAGALLAVFPLPPRQLLERAEAGDEQSAAPAAVVGLRPPTTNELAVAEHAGPWIAAAWVQPGSTAGTVRLFDFNMHPVPATISVAGASVSSCGNGCAVFRLRPPSSSLRIAARSASQAHSAKIPIQWDPRGAAEARRILTSAVEGVDRLRTQRIAERLSSGLGRPPTVSAYRIAGRYRYAIVGHGRGASDIVVIGRQYWFRPAGHPWESYKVPREDSRQLMPWWPHRRNVRLLGLHMAGGRRIADIALADIPRRRGQAPPFWFRLRIDVASGHVLTMRMIAPAHFMDQRYFAFDAPVQVTPPMGRR